MIAVGQILVSDKPFKAVLTNFPYSTFPYSVGFKNPTYI